MERAGARAWPASIERPTSDGWLLRATPGLDRARSNNALTPCRALSAEEIPAALERVHACAREQAVRPGIQVSPGWLHAPLQLLLDDRGWTASGPHATTVFALLRGRASFARVDQHAVAITVEDDGLLGLFCVAVDPERRRAGLGSLLMRALLARARAVQAYLQVDARNAAAIGMYLGLGFTEAYSYCHRSPPGLP